MEIPQPNSFGQLTEFVQGSILLIDKPYDWTSFDVLNRIKGFVRHHVEIPANEHGHDQRFKIGHAGTLDPLATGLLVVCTGKYTKKIDSLMAGVKEYTGTIRFGQTTPSYDLETAPEGVFEVSHLSMEKLQAGALKLTGDIWQQPPVFSAKQVDGKRAYHAARKGQSIIIPAVPVQVSLFEITSFDGLDAEFRIRCSKGTYIRSLAHDLGQLLESGSHLVALRRTESAPFRIEDAISLDHLLLKLEGFQQ
jgi:tRNA pseudouridine55 synthase